MRLPLTTGASPDLPARHVDEPQKGAENRFKTVRTIDTAVNLRLVAFATTIRSGRDVTLLPLTLNFFSSHVSQVWAERASEGNQWTLLCRVRKNDSFEASSLY